MADQVTGLFSPFLRARRLAAALPYLSGLPSGRVLDVGCGVGELARWFEPGAYLGVDRDEESLAEARRRHPRHRFLPLAEWNAVSAVSIEPTIEPAIEPAVETSARFDRIAALALIEHLDAPGAWLAEMRGVLAPGGLLVLTTPEPRLQGVHDVGARLGLFSRAGAAEHQSLLDRRRLEPLAAAAGLEVVEARRFLGGANQLFVLAAAGGAGGGGRAG